MISSDFKELIRPLNEEEYAALEKSIIEEGCRDRLVMWNGFIIDGHHRYQICQEHNIEFKTINLELEDKERVKLWIINNQLARRNLNKEEFTYFLGEKYHQTKKFSGEHGEVGQSDPLRTSERVAQEHEGVSERTVRRAAGYTNAVNTVDENVGKGTKDKILSGKIKATKNAVIALSREEPEKQRKVIEKAIENPKIPIDVLKYEITREENKEKAKQQPIPNDKFTVIYADPPWRYSNATQNRKVENHYPTLTLEQIKELNIPANDNAVLLLWSTAPKIQEALDVMKNWGFVYKSQFVWDKEIIGMGYWVRGQHELLLIGTKGWFPPPEPEDRYSSVIREKRTEHSKKPDIVYEMIEKMFPDEKYLELFARQQYNCNWTIWGNEL